MFCLHLVRIFLVVVFIMRTNVNRFCSWIYIHPYHIKSFRIYGKYGKYAKFGHTTYSTAPHSTCCARFFIIVEVDRTNRELRDRKNKNVLIFLFACYPCCKKYTRWCLKRCSSLDIHSSTIRYTYIEMLCYAYVYMNITMAFPGVCIICVRFQRFKSPIWIYDAGPLR